MAAEPTAFLHPGVPMADYVADKFDLPPTLSSSVAHTLLTRSPFHAKERHPRLAASWAPEEKDGTDLGSACHAILLEKNEDAVLVGKWANWRTDASQAFRSEARAAGKVAVLTKDMTAIRIMVEKAQRKLADCPDLVGIGPMVPELTLMWRDGETWLRSRPDWLTEDFGLVISFKTTGNAEPSVFVRGPMQSHEYDMQAAFEIAGVKAATGRDAKYVWLVSEAHPPYAASLVGLDPQWHAFAETKRRKAVALWTACITENRWPEYPDRICYPELPPWLEAKYVERHGYAPPPADDGRPIEEQLFERGVMP